MHYGVAFVRFCNEDIVTTAWASEVRKGLLWTQIQLKDICGSKSRLKEETIIAKGPKLLMLLRAARIIEDEAVAAAAAGGAEHQG